MAYNTARFGLNTDDVIGLTEAQRLSVEFLMTFSVVDEATWLYKNYRYPRYKNFYGYAQIMTGGYVVQNVKLEHINQEILHWQQSSTDVLQSVGCGIKKVLANLTPPVASQVTLYLLRQRYTSVRFRLLPGIVANVALNWHFPELLCDETLVAPPEAQGNPQATDNMHGDPANRPTDQGQDGKDRSNNDGKDDPNDDRPHEPVPGSAVAVMGQWFAIIAGIDGNNQTYSGYRYALPGATNQAIVPMLVNVRPSSPAGYFQAEVVYGGTIVNRPDGYSSYTFEFVPGT